MKIRVLTESGCGLTKQEANDLGIDFLPLQVQIEDKTYLDGVDLTVDELNSFLERGFMPQTSMPPLGDIEALLESYKKDGITDVILITLSNGLSGTNQAIQASGKWHGVKIHTLDIYTTLGVEKYLVLSAQKLVEQKIHPEEIISRLKESVEHSRGFLIPEDLDHLAKGGRLTPMAAKLAGMLKIKPILEVSKNTEGKVDVFDKVRTMSKAIKKAVKVVSKDANAQDYEFYDPVLHCWKKTAVFNCFCLKNFWLSRICFFQNDTAEGRCSNINSDCFHDQSASPMFSVF